MTTTALTPTKLWLIEDNIRSWTASLQQALRSSHLPSTVPRLVVRIMANRPIITAENVNMQFWDCHRWKLTSTDTWMNSYPRCSVTSGQSESEMPVLQSTIFALAEIHELIVMWETLLEQSQVDEVKIQFKVHFLTY